MHRVEVEGEVSVRIAARDDLKVHREYMARIEPMRSGLLWLLEDVAQRQAAHDHRPTPGSLAAAEVIEEPTFAEHIGGRPVVNARLMGTIQLAAAADHLGALCRLLELEATVLYADKVLARAGIESAARALWLLDPSIGARTRVARGLSERLHDTFQAGRLLGDDDPSERNADREALLQRASAAGFKYFTPKKNPAYVERERPSATAVMRQLLDADPADDADDSLGAGTQRYLSTFVHATMVGLHSVISLDEVVDAGDGVNSAPLVSNSATVSSLIALCSLAWTAASTPYLNYMGWSDTSWTRSVLNHVGIMRSYL